MKKTTSLSLALAIFISSFASLASARQATPQQQRPPLSVPSTQPQSREAARPASSAAAQDDEDDVVRITTNLVQMDVVVADKKGNQVTDLTAEDFEVYEDKRQQKITNFSYVLNEPATRTPAPAEIASASASRSLTTNRNAPPAPLRRLRPEQVRRTMALVFDGEAATLNLASPLPDPKRIELGGSIKLGSNLEPGEYVLQIVVTDMLATGKHRTATQWVDFEIVK